MHPMPSTFNRSPANTNPLSASAPSPAASPQDWLKQSGALGSLGGLALHTSGSDATAGRRELYRVDLQVLLNLLLSMHSPMLCLYTHRQHQVYQAATISLIDSMILAVPPVPTLTTLYAMQGSSSPLSPPVSTSGFMASQHTSASPPDSLTAGCSMSKAVSAKPFSIQHSAEAMKPAQSHDYALPWLDVTASDATQQSDAEDVARGPGRRTENSQAPHLDLQNGQLYEHPFAESRGAPASHEWAFKTSQSLSLLDM